MLILSQDRTEIVNLDVIENIWICSDDGTFTIEASADMNASLGCYDTEERAKEVLKEIVNKYSEYLKLKGEPAIIHNGLDVRPYIFNIPKVYEMPLD